MKESVALAKDADAKKDFSSTRSDNSIHRVRNEPEKQLGSLRSVIGNIRHDGGTPSLDSIATELSSMHTAQRASVLLALQRTHGNRYVQRVVAGIQAKLTIGQPGDKYEQEADRVAEQVMRMPEPHVQRQAEEEELIQPKPLAGRITPLVQRQADKEEQEEEEEEEEEILQTKEIPDKTLEDTPNLESRIQALRGGGQPFPESVRAFFEPRFGYDFSQVRVHTDPKAVKAAKSVNAQAFTVGRDIVFGTGQYAPETSSGKKLLAHELTHVVQQEKDSFWEAGSPWRSYNVPIVREKEQAAEKSNEYAEERKMTPGLGPDASVYLEFNGTELKILRPGGRIGTFPAVSGREAFRSDINTTVEAQKRRGEGPIPAGGYWVDPRQTTFVIFGREAWGPRRLTLHPFATTQTSGRGGFFIHGGAAPGSAGCIDLTSHVMSFFDLLGLSLRIYDADKRNPRVKLWVRYPERIQKQADEEEKRKREEEQIQTEPFSEQISPLVQRQLEEEEELLQTKQIRSHTPAIPPDLESHIQSLRGGGQLLPESVRAFFEPRFGNDFSKVRIHTDARAGKTAEALNARAFTTGRDVFFRHGTYNPGTSSGRQLLGHELTHVAQQTVGLRRKMTLGQPGERYEQKADPVARGLIRQEQRAGSQGKAYRPTDEEEVKEIKTKGIADILRRQAEEEEEESVRVWAESGSLRGQAERELGAVQSRKEISRLRLRSEGEKVLRTTREGYLMQQREKVRNKPEPVATQHQPEGEESIEDPELELLLILGGKVREEYAYEDIEQLHAYLQRIQQKQPELESVLKPLLEKYFPNQGEAVWEQSQQPIASFAGRFGSLKIILYDCDSDQADFFKIQADLIANAINAVEIPSSCRPRNRTRLRLGTGGTPFTNNSITPVLERAHNCVGRRVDEVHIVGHSHQGMNFSEETSEAIGTHVSSKGRVIFHGCSVLSSDNEADLASLLEQLGSEAVIYAHAMAGEAGRPFEFYKITLPAGEDTIRKELLQKVTVILPKEYIREWAKMKIRYNKTNELYDMLSKKQELNLQRDTEEIIIQDLIELLERRVRRWSIRQLRRAYRRRLYDWEKAVIKAEITVRELAREGLLIR